MFKGISLKINSRYLLLLPFLAGVFVAADDQTVIVTVLPEIIADMKIGPGELDLASWAVTGYLIGFTAAMPLMGKVADRIGLRTGFIAALGVFTVGSIAVPLSSDIPKWLDIDPQYFALVGARVVQAIGGGALIPIAIASAGVLMTPSSRAIAFGLIGASAEAGAVVGPLWGGAITHLLSWEWVFWLNIPPVLIVAAFVARTPRGRSYRASIDLIGGFLFAALLSLGTLALIRVGRPDGLMAIFAVAAAASAALLVWRHHRTPEPLIPRGVLSRANFSAASAAHVLIGAALIIGMVTVPLMANTVLGDSPLEGGLRLLRMTVAIGVGALVGGLATQRKGPRIPAIAGLVLTAIGFALMSRWTLDVHDPWMTVHLAVTGLGFGLLVAPVTESALHNVRPHVLGAASALITVARMAGMTAGLAAITGWGTIRFANLISGLPAYSADPEVQKQFTDASFAAAMTVFQGFFIAAAVMSVMAIVPAIAMTSRYRMGSEHGVPTDLD